MFPTVVPEIPSFGMNIVFDVMGGGTNLYYAK